MPVNYVHRGHVDGAAGAAVAVSGPIPVLAGEILAVTVVTDSYTGSLASLLVYTTAPDWGFNHRVDYDEAIGGYAGVFALAFVPADASPVIHVEVTGGPPAGHRRPSFDIWTITGADPSGPVVQTDTAGMLARNGHLIFNSAAGSRGNTLALIAAVDVLHNSAPYVYGDGVTPGFGFAQSGPAGPPGVSGFGTAVRWAVPGATYYTGVNLGTGYPPEPACLAAVMEFNPAPVAPVVDAGSDRTVERTKGVIRTAGESTDPAVPVTARQWRLMSGPGGSGAPVDLAAYGGDPKRCLLPRDVAGAHVIRYTATNSVGPSYDEATITVTPLRPTVNAGPDEARAAGLLTRTATEAAGDNAITAREWKIVEGPTAVGTVIGSAAALSWTPPSLGRWVLRYTATSSAGTSDPDDAVITVGVTGVPLRIARTPAPRLAVAIAFGGNLADPDGSEWAFTEVTTDVRIAQGVHLRHGRSDEAGTAQPATCRFVLGNPDGRYTLGGWSPYWPNIRQGTPIQVSCDLGAGFETLFLGYADGFTPGWSTVPLRMGDGRIQRGDAVVKVSASGILRRLAQGNPPQISPMRRALTTAAGVVAYWPCEDEEGARQIASAFPDHPAMDFSGRIHGGSNPGLPAATPRLGQSSVFDCSGPLPLVSDSEWYGNVPNYTATSVIGLRFLIDVPAAGSNDSAVLIGLITTGDPAFWELRYKSGGVVNVRAWRYFTTLVLDQNVAFNLDGRRGQFGISLTQNGGAVDYQLDFLEVGATSAGIYNGSVASSTLGKATRVQTATDGGHMDVTLGHIVVRNVARNAAENIRYLNAWRGENVGERLLRLVTENALWYVQLDGPVLNVAVTDYMGPQPAGTLLDLLRTCEACDQGILFDGLNPGATYTTKRYRESRPPALVLDATASEVGLPFTPAHDDAYRVNRAAASRRGGSNAVYADTAGPLGSDIVGRYDDSLTVDVIADAALIQYAAWMVHQGTCEGYRYPQLSLNLTAAPHLLDEWLTIVPGDRVDVVNLSEVTGAAPGETVSLAVEGYEQTITPSTWTVIMNTSLYRRWAVAVVCDETGDVREFGARVDTNGTVIAALTAAGQTVLTVDVSAGPAWTTRADDYPLTLDVGAVPVRATACTAPGVGGNPVRQSFTIDPMPVTRPPGTRVQLWNPPVFGL